MTRDTSDEGGYARDEWFDTFDQRGLNFLFQQTHTDGSDSNFFRLENPDREDA